MIKIFKQSLKLNNFKTFITLFFILLALLGLLVFQSNRLSLFNPQNLSSKSSADIKLEKNKLIVLFVIDQNDQSKAQAFSQKLNIDQNWTKGLILDLDQSSADKIRPLLPIHLNLYFKENSLEFSNSIFNNLKSSLPNQKYEYATFSAKALLEKNSDKDFFVQLIEPDILLKQATLSGTVNLSSKIISVFPILERIAKIELTDKNGSINGVIQLKN